MNHLRSKFRLNKEVFSFIHSSTMCKELLRTMTTRYVLNSIVLNIGKADSHVDSFLHHSRV